VKKTLILLLLLLAVEDCYIDYYVDKDGTVQSILICDFEDPEYA